MIISMERPRPSSHTIPRPTFHKIDFFLQVSGLPQATRYSYTRSGMQGIRDGAKQGRQSIQVSYAPSPLDFARRNHNVDWANYLIDGVVQEVAKTHSVGPSGLFGTELRCLLNTM